MKYPYHNVIDKALNGETSTFYKDSHCLSIIFTLVGTDLPGLQPSQAVTFQPGGSTIRAVNFTVTNDDTVECTEAFGLNLVTLNSKRLQIDSTRGEADVNIIDDDGMFFNFFI